MISVGSTVGNYRVVSLLGAGAMATVFLAEHPRINKKVAIKVIHHELASNKEMVSRFFTEARAASQINHENVVDILDFGQTPEGDNFMVMEYLDGQTISSRLRAAGRLEVPVALHITMQIVDALAAAHQKGVIHRDLKPDNIFLVRRLTNPDYVKILDFGLAKLLIGGEMQQHKTSSGSVLGTPHYMAPEQCEGKPTIDGRADLYSVGCILYQMVTGKLPFPGDGFAEVLIKHLSEPPPLPSASVPGMPASVEKLILHCLAKKVDYRFQSAPELLQALYDPEAFSQRIGNDPIAICGPMPGGTQLSPLPGSQLATMVGNVPAGLAGGARPQATADSTSILGPAGDAHPAGNLSTVPVATTDQGTRPMGGNLGEFGQNLGPPAPPRPLSAPALPPPPFGSRPGPLASTLGPGQQAGGPPPFAPPGAPPSFGGPVRDLATVVGGDALPEGALAARSVAASAGASNLVPLPEPPRYVPQSAAASSQLAELPVVANRAAPQMATMIGEMAPATMSALVAASPPPPQLPPPPPGPRSQPGYPSGPTASDGFRELSQASASAFGEGVDDLGFGPPVLPSTNLGQPGAGAPHSWPPPASSQPSFSQTNMPLVPGYSGNSQPGVGSASQNAPLPAWAERLRPLPVMQKFLALPPPRRLLVLRVGAGVLGGFVLLLLLLLLWPSRRATIIVRSDPDQATVQSDGQPLGETPIVVELKNHTVMKLALHKDGYEDADEDINADGEHVVLIKLNKQLTGDAQPKPPKPEAKKDPVRPGKKTDPDAQTSDPPIKADPPKNDPIKADPPKADPPKADPPKADPPENSGSKKPGKTKPAKPTKKPGKAKKSKKVVVF